MTDNMNILLPIVCLCLINTILGFMFNHFDKKYRFLYARIAALENKLNNK